MTSRRRGGAGRGSGKDGSGKSGAGKGASIHVSVQRTPTVRLKRKKGRTNSQQRWLQRQLNDPFVSEARRRGLRSRAAFKLMELDQRFNLLKPGARVVDLGAAPGGWSQVSADIVGPNGVIVGIDLLPIDSIEGAIFIEGDFLEPDAPDRLKRELGGAADLVLSDMAASSSGHAGTDHLKIVALAEIAFDFAATVLAPGGAFVAKVLQGGTEKTLLTLLRGNFDKVIHAKPEASRKESAELYVVATGFHGAAVLKSESELED
ncbi:MAG: RlmE family RNA methyltransferase [Rhodospirillaceae bacterium]|jgi:23S rRNA (uridine2552-2'-O)-methyltransferase|nr:RlmE family RNA methyltransferase [Rhodospirillaceae bacterium]MBT5812000.1 RlmE family RNA methyltransferase [Rhodospirillaceae bacterium]